MAGISSISDVHIMNSDDLRYEKLLKFLHSDEVEASDIVIFLGDIFDLMIGNHREYIERYPIFFNRLKELDDKGKRIIYFEGNHDLHLGDLFKRYTPFVETRLEPFIINYKGKNIHYSHGDNFDMQNVSYQRYIKVLRSSFCKFLADKIVPYKIISLIGEEASSRSRKRSESYQIDNRDDLKNNYRENIIGSIGPDVDGVVFGHSHFTEEEHELKSRKLFVLNNGFFPETNKFVFISETENKLISLT